MIELPNGHRFDFATASGALGFDGRGWPWEWPLRWVGLLDPRAFTVVAKTVTYFPVRGNLSLRHPWTCVRLLPGGGVTNAVGLTNPGICYWVDCYYVEAIKKGYLIAASVRPDDPYQAGRMAWRLKDLTLPYVEVNVSCPNTAEVPADVPEMLKGLRACGHPLVLKLSEDQVTGGFVAATEPFVSAYHAINTVPWDQVYPGHSSPIERYDHGRQGGVSGPPIRGRALAAVRRLRGMTTRPVVGGGGIASADDVRAFADAGAAAFSIGTCFLRTPWRPNRIVRGYRGGGT